MVTEGSVICHLPQDEILDALIGLLGSFYIFNVSYNQSKAILTFLEQALLEIRVLSLFPPFSMSWQMPEVVLAESIHIDNI